MNKEVKISNFIMLLLIMVGMVFIYSQYRAQHPYVSQADAVAAMLQENNAQVARDMERQYDMAYRLSSPAERCVQAGLVVAAFLQANNSDKYASWKKHQRTDCKAAGVKIQ